LVHTAISELKLLDPLFCLQTEKKDCLETMLHIYQTARRRMPERKFYMRLCGNMRSYVGLLTVLYYFRHKHQDIIHFVVVN